nr:hypothetical protein [Tanacetum cinerariifolium]
MEAGSKDRPPMLAPDKEVLISKGSPGTRTESHMDSYKTVSQDIHDQLNAEAEAVQIILTGIDNDIYSTVDACSNACEMWKAIKMLKQVLTSTTTRMTKNEVNEIRAERIAHVANLLALVAQQQPDNEIDKLMDLISLSFKKIYKPTNNNLRTSSNTCRENQDNSPRINRSNGYENQRIGNVAGARETVDATDSGPIFDTEPVQKVSTDDHYNVFAIESEHPEQSESIHDTYPIEQDEHKVIIDSLDMSYEREQINQNDDDANLVNE